MPFVIVRGLLSPALVQSSIESICEATTGANFKSSLLHHTEIFDPSSQQPYCQFDEIIMPRLMDFGALLFGEALNWSIKEIWTNLMEPGGYQAIHNHSNSFISGIIYLTESHPSSRTVFHRSIGGREFIFSNDNPNAEMGAFNGNKWVAPEMKPGDMVLFPSYLLHEVPQNQGQRRITIAFNAIPERLDSWGYAVSFNSYRSGQDQ